MHHSWGGGGGEVGGEGEGVMAGGGGGGGGAHVKAANVIECGFLVYFVRRLGQ